MRKNGIRITKTAFDMMNEFMDLQNSYITKVSPKIGGKLGERTFLVVENGDIIAVYDRGGFKWNPNKVKIKDLESYDVYEVTMQGTHVQNRREERRNYLWGLCDRPPAARSRKRRDCRCAAWGRSHRQASFQKKWTYPVIAGK